MRKNAFTLTEILIAIGIIGVIAAITVPILSINIRNKVLEYKFKSTYALIQNAMINIREQEPDLYNKMKRASSNAAAYTVFGALLKQNLKIGKDYRYQGLFTYFSQYYRNYENKATSIAGWGNYGQIMLLNGAILYTECSGSCSSMHLFFDTNGKAGPNRNGFDFFHLQLNSNSQLVPTTFWETSCNKSKTAASAGLGCTKNAINDKNYFKNLPK